MPEQEIDRLARFLELAQDGVANTVTNYEAELRLFIQLRSPDADRLEHLRDAITDILIEHDRWKAASNAYVEALRKLSPEALRKL